MIARCRNIKHLRYFIKEKNTSLVFLNANEIKDSNDVVLTYLKKTIDELCPIDKEAGFRKKQLLELNHGVKYGEYDARKNEIIIKTSIFDELFWHQQYYNAIMKSAMNHHFIKILNEKGYTIEVNEEVIESNINRKELAEHVKQNFENTVENIVNNPDGELTASEQKIKAMMDKRADFLHIDINKKDDKKYEIYKNTKMKL